MELNYNHSESTVKPTALEVTEDTVYFRKDIVKITRTSKLDGNATIYYTYQEATLTPKEFNEYINLVMAENAIKSINDSSHIVSLLESQTVTDNNQLIVMEAIADLYNVLDKLT